MLDNAALVSTFSFQPFFWFAAHFLAKKFGDNIKWFENYFEVPEILNETNIFSIPKQNITVPGRVSLTLEQGCATIFGSRATLETKMVYAGQYKYHICTFLTFLI